MIIPMVVVVVVLDSGGGDRVPRGKGMYRKQKHSQFLYLVLAVQLQVNRLWFDLCFMFLKIWHIVVYGYIT